MPDADGFGLNASRTSKFLLPLNCRSTFALRTTCLFFSFRDRFSFHVTSHSMIAPPKNARKMLNDTVAQVKHPAITQNSPCVRSMSLMSAKFMPKKEETKDKGR